LTQRPVYRWLHAYPAPYAMDVSPVSPRLSPSTLLRSPHCRIVETNHADRRKHRVATRIWR
jgi:hypothetical protein